MSPADAPAEPDPAEPDPADLDPGWLARLVAADAALAGPSAAGPGPLGWEANCLELLDRAREGGLDPADIPIPAAIDRYRVIREVGRGGFGVVYQAHDPQVGRDVALKTPLPGLAHSADVRRRFTREAQAVAGLDHPNIIPIHDARTVGPVAFIASAYCPGPSLAAWLKGRAEPVPCREAARLVLGLARGVAHAHARGITHRDLKPANVMLQPGDDGAAGELTPRVTDFGLAKLADEAGVEATRAGLVVGSAPYMAPEQAAGAGGADAAGPAVDIYALGVTLYEILVGRPPFAGRSQAEVLHQVVHGELVAPQLLRREIPRDLQTICLHALRRNPKGRYPGAAALADDLDRYLAGEPVVARPPSGPERAWRWAGRHPVAATSVVAAALLAVVVVAGLGWANARLRAGNDQLAREAERADRHARAVARHLHAARLNLARQAIEAGQDERAQAILAEDDGATGAPRRDFAWTYLWRLSRRHLAVWGHHDAWIGRVALAPDGRTFATGDRAGHVQLWDVAAGRPRASFDLSAGAVEGLAFAADSALLATAGHAPAAPKAAVRVELWDAGSGRALGGVDLPRARQVGRLAVVAGGRAVAILVADEPEGVDPASWRLVWLARSADGRLDPSHEVPGCRGLAEAPDGASLWVAEAGGRVRRRDARTGRVLATLSTGLPEPVTLAAAPDGRHLAAAIPPGRVLLWDLAEPGSPPRPLADLAVRPNELIFRPGGGAILAVEGGFEAQLIPLDGGPGVPVLPLDLDRRGQLHFAFSPDGRWLVSYGEIRPGGGPQPVTVRDAATGRVERTFPGRLLFTKARFDARSDALLMANDYDVAAWRPFEPPAAAIAEFPDHEDEVWSVAFSPDGQTLASGGDDDHLRFFRPGTGARAHVKNPHAATVAAVAWHPGGLTVASGGLTGADNLKLHDARTGDEVATLAGHTDQVRAVVFSPDGAVLASAGTDRVIRLWGGATGAPLGQLSGHEDLVRGLAFAPDGRHLASAGNEGVVRIWDPARRCPVATLAGRFSASAVAFSPDGRTLASADAGGYIHLRDATTWETRRAVRADDCEIRALAFAPDGQTLAAGGVSRAIRFWDPATGQLLMEIRDATTDQVNSLAFAPDGATLAVADHGGRVLLVRAEGDR